MSPRQYSHEQNLLDLQAKCPRKVPTLAFTMPQDNDEAGMTAWIAHLKSLFPSKPAPKMKLVAKSNRP